MSAPDRGVRLTFRRVRIDGAEATYTILAETPHAEPATSTLRTEGGKVQLEPLVPPRAASVTEIALALGKTLAKNAPSDGWPLEIVRWRAEKVSRRRHDADRSLTHPGPRA